MSILGIGLSLLGGGGIIGLVLAFVPGAGAIAGKAVSGTISFLSAIPWAKVWWLLPIGAALAFGFYQMYERGKAEKKIPALEQRAADSHAAFLAQKHEFIVEKAGLDQARKIIGENNRRILAGAADLDRAKRDAAAADARNDKLAQSTDARIAALRSAAGRHSAPCTLSNEARQELENQ